MTDTYPALKARQREERANHPTNLALRVHRALSWLHRAEQCEDTDGRFIFLWVAFNAAYAQDLRVIESHRESDKYSQFLEKLVALDAKRALYNLIWQEFSGSIRLLLQNRFVFGPFWEYQRGVIDEAAWQEAFQRANRAATIALGNTDTLSTLSIVLARLYVLRNQLVHGGATWNSTINRDQLRDASAFLGKLVPVIIETMMDHPETLWGDAIYPVVES